ncbi:MAG: hypothetical protein PVG39_26145 [Desulfobacteraceae bacterium]|jgi:hypothetical protein
MEGRFKGRDVVNKPSCPFCGIYLKKPSELDNGMPQEMPVGACECGAVYTCDVTGHNLGTAMTEALVFACNGDWDLAWDLLPEDDYLVAELEEYDYQSHLIVHSGAYEGRNVTGVLYFVKLHDDVLEVTEEGFRRKLEKKSIHPISGPHKNKTKSRLSKSDIEKLVSGYNIKVILELSMQDKKIIRLIQRLIYSADDLLRMKATDALGQASAVIAEYDPGAVSKLLKNLFISISDTAASSWGAIDAIGQIISNSARLYASYTPQLYKFIPDRELLPEVLRAMSNITASEPEPFRKIRFSLLPFLKDKDTEILGYTIIIMGNLKAKEATADLITLVNCRETIKIYNNGSFEEKTIGALADAAIKIISSK